MILVRTSRGNDALNGAYKASGTICTMKEGKWTGLTGIGLSLSAFNRPSLAASTLAAARLMKSLSGMPSEFIVEVRTSKLAKRKK
jgi:hypothetical protein